MTKQTTQSRVPQSVATYTLKSLLITFVCLTLLIALSITCLGVYRTFLMQKQKSESYALILAHSAGMAYGLGTDLSAHQAEDILETESSITDINFYSVQEQLDTSDAMKNLFLVAWTEDSYDINQQIIYNNLLDKNLLRQLPNVDISQLKNDTLTGYINIQLDVKGMRYHWIMSHLYVYGIILLIGILLFFVILRLNNRSIDQIKELQFVANNLFDIDEDGFLGLPFLKKNIQFVEYIDIQNSFIRLVETHNELKRENNQLNLLETQSQVADDSSYLRQARIQKIIGKELSNSLKTISENVHLLGRQYLLDEQKDALSSIRRGSQQMQFVLDQIVYFQQLENGEIRVNRVEFNPLQLISDLVTEFHPRSSKKNIEILSNITHAEHRLEGDIEKIQTILNALIENAINFTQVGSVVIESHLQYFDNSTRWTVRVKDTGIGIASDQLEHIFEPFVQLDNELQSDCQGIGIGLTIAKQLANVMEAKLSVSSELGKGSTFELVIPLFNKSQLLEHRYLRGVSIACFQQNDGRELIEKFYNSGAKKVLSLHNIDEALDSLIKEPVDVLVIASDVSRRQTMNLVRSFRNDETNHRSLIVCLVDYDKRFTEAEQQSVGIDVLLTMPITQKDLAIAIKNWLR